MSSALLTSIVLWLRGYRSWIFFCGSDIFLALLEMDRTLLLDQARVMSDSGPVFVSGVRLRCLRDDLIVEVQMGGEWVEIIREDFHLHVSTEVSAASIMVMANGS